MRYDEELIGRLAEDWRARAWGHRRIFVGCSGGPDSMALAFALRIILQGSKAGKETHLGLLHVNYALRGAESDEDQRLVERYAAEAGMELRILDVRTAELAARKAAEGIQEWARRVRRAWFAQIARAHDAVIALAHHQNDLAENVLLRLARGSGAGQLAGMSEFDNPYWRPWLRVPKDDIVGLITRQHIPHRHDSSNVKLDYSRNKIRLQILPELEALYPGAAGRIAATAMEARELSSFVRSSASHAITCDASGRRTLAGAVLRGLSRGVGIELISELAKQSCGDGLQLSRSTLYRAWAHVAKAENDVRHQWRCELKPGVFLALKDDKVTVEKSQTPPCQVRFRQHISNMIGWDCRFRLAAGATVEIARSDGLVRLVNPSPLGRSITIRSAQSQDKVPLPDLNGTSKVWRFGSLMKSWGAQGRNHPVIHVDDRVAGLLDGDQVVTAGRGGVKQGLCPLAGLLKGACPTGAVNIYRP